MYLSNSELKQLAILKKKNPTERFSLMIQLIGGQIEAMRAGIRHQNPTINEKEVTQCLKKRIAKIYSLKQ